MKKICALLFIFSLLLVSTVNASTIYTVKKGDSLYSISKKFNIQISEIKKANNLKSSKLNSGMRLIIPENNKKEIAKNKIESTNKYQQHIDDIKTYTVKKGDTIWRISRKFDISVDELKEINELEGNSIKIGQKLYISSKVDNAAIEDIIKTLQAKKDASAAMINEDNVNSNRSAELSNMSIKERLILFAKQLLDIPYKFGGNSLLGIDCSAYVQKVFGSAGINLPRTAREQFKVGDPVNKDELLIGDLVFFRTYASFPSHVGIYLGNNLFIHASTQAKRVIIASLEIPYFTKRFIGAKRLLNEEYKTAIEFPNDKH